MTKIAWNLYYPAIIASAMVISSSALAQSLSAPRPGDAPEGPLGIPTGSAILYDQTGTPGGIGWTSQNFEAALDANDSQLADDFFVTEPAGWTVTQVNVLGTVQATTPVSSANLWIYADAAGAPGAVVCSYPALAVTDDGTGNLEAPLPTVCELSGELNYWVSVQANKDFDPDGQWFWFDSIPLAGSPSQWQNPGDGFASGCTTWTAKQTCLGGDPDLSFAIAGTLGTGGSRATFTVTKDFTDDNPNGVEVIISCNTGLPLEQSKVITEGESVEFVVTEFDNQELDCEVTEDVPFGYVPEYFDGTSTSSTSCEFLDVVFGSELSCEITNTPGPVDVVIHKDWVFEGSSDPQGIDQRYDLTLWCDAEIVGGVNFGQLQEAPSGNGLPCGLIALPGQDGPQGIADWCKAFFGEGPETFIAEVIPEFPDSHCFVIERLSDSAVEVDNGCRNITVSAGNGAECTITNTVFFEGIPTLNQYGMALLAMLMLGVGFVGFRRFA